VFLSVFHKDKKGHRALKYFMDSQIPFKIERLYISTYNLLPGATLVMLMFGHLSNRLGSLPGSIG